MDVVTAIEDGCAELPDDQPLVRAGSLGRVIFPQVIRFKALAEDWQRQGRHFANLLFGHQFRATLGCYVNDLELIAGATEPEEWSDKVGLCLPEASASCDTPGAETGIESNATKLSHLFPAEYLQEYPHILP